MDLMPIAEALKASSLSEWMRGSLRALPVIESIHVMAVAVVFGTIAIIDLRLLGGDVGLQALQSGLAVRQGVGGFVVLLADLADFFRDLDAGDAIVLGAELQPAAVVEPG